MMRTRAAFAALSAASHPFPRFLTQASSVRE
jgi:hypothetical protein